MRRSENIHNFKVAVDAYRVNESENGFRSVDYSAESMVPRTRIAYYEEGYRILYLAYTQRHIIDTESKIM